MLNEIERSGSERQQELIEQLMKNVEIEEAVAGEDADASTEDEQEKEFVQKFCSAFDKKEESLLHKYDLHWLDSFVEYLLDKLHQVYFRS
ncbi:hypothetical protein AAVH_00962 [Aphelenchoides avenae]|nr:hypothetical protein AAVH_26721 [Aphelenchus avenae]KAH7732064.1 hypothetical protein AAVH_00962 [Aphelenchus avenae]